MTQIFPRHYVFLLVIRKKKKIYSHLLGTSVQNELPGGGNGACTERVLVFFRKAGLFSPIGTKEREAAG